MTEVVRQPFFVVQRENSCSLVKVKVIVSDSGRIS